MLAAYSGSARLLGVAPWAYWFAGATAVAFAAGALGRRAFVPLAAVAMLLGGGFMVAFGRSTYFGEIVSNFQWHLGLGALVFAAVAAIQGRRRLLVAFVALAAVLLYPEARLSFGSPSQAPSAGAGVRLASANLFLHNDPAGIAAWLSGRDEDVLLLQEVSFSMLPVVLAAGYPHRAVWPGQQEWSPSTWGLAILSRLPIEDFRPVDLGDWALPALEARIRVPSGHLHMVNAHMPQPLVADPAVRAAAWERLLGGVAWSSRSFLAGDLNATITSPYLRNFLDQSPLRDTRAGFGRQGTWPSPWFLMPLRLAIDHGLAGSAITVTGRSLIRVPGSDHLGTRFELAVEPGI